MLLFFIAGTTIAADVEGPQGCSEQTYDTMAHLEPEEPWTDDDVYVLVTCNNPDQPVVYSWFRNGTIDPELIGPILPASATAPGDQWVVEIGNGEATLADVSFCITGPGCRRTTGPQGFAMLAADTPADMQALASALQTETLGFEQFVDLRVETPTAEDLEGISTVLVWVDGPPADPVALGDTLLDLIEADVGVVVAGWSFDNDPARGLSGDIVDALPLGLGPTSFIQGLTYDVLVDDHPIVDGVDAFSLGWSGGHHTPVSVAADAEVVAEFTDGTPAIAWRAGNARSIVALNFPPMSGFVDGGNWEGDGHVLLQNALLFADDVGDGIPPVRGEGPSISWVELPPERMTEGRFQVSVSDPDDDVTELTVFLFSDVDGQNGGSATPNPDGSAFPYLRLVSDGPHQITAAVFDSDGNSDQVTAPTTRNQPPVYVSHTLDPQDPVVGEPITATVVASDPNDDPVTITLQWLPAGATRPDELIAGSVITPEVAGQWTLGAELNDGFTTVYVSIQDFFVRLPGDDPDGDGYTTDDCAPLDASINPGMPEIYYNDLEDDCDPLTVDDDKDADGFARGPDCDDEDPRINPNAVEVRDSGIDEDCDPSTLDSEGTRDRDHDGFVPPLDCDETRTAVNPDATELPYNGLDDDCNPATRDDDIDGDGFILREDCNDYDSDINPNATDTTDDDVDEDCDPDTPVPRTDEDGDGSFVPFDCNDNDPRIRPAAGGEYVGDGIDMDCDGTDGVGLSEFDSYVAPWGSDTNPGTADEPYGTIRYAMQQGSPGDRVIAAAGLYGFQAWQVDGVSLYGGFVAENDWAYDPNSATVIGQSDGNTSFIGTRNASEDDPVLSVIADITVHSAGEAFIAVDTRVRAERINVFGRYSINNSEVRLIDCTGTHDVGVAGAGISVTGEDAQAVIIRGEYASSDDLHSLSVVLGGSAELHDVDFTRGKGLLIRGNVTANNTTVNGTGPDQAIRTDQPINLDWSGGVIQHPVRAILANGGVNALFHHATIYGGIDAYNADTHAQLVATWVEAGSYAGYALNGAKLTFVNSSLSLGVDSIGLLETWNGSEMTVFNTMLFSEVGSHALVFGQTDHIDFAGNLLIGGGLSFRPWPRVGVPRETTEYDALQSCGDPFWPSTACGYVVENQMDNTGERQANPNAPSSPGPLSIRTDRGVDPYLWSTHPRLNQDWYGWPRPQRNGWDIGLVERPND